jgi:mannosyltransferase
MLDYVRNTELHASPYYIALHPWTALGTSEAALRSLSVVFGVMAVLAAWAIGRRYGVAFAAALILSLTPVFVQYEQEARAYSLLMAVSAVSTLLFLRLVERQTLLRAMAYVAVAGALIYVHPIGAFTVVAHGLAVALFQPRREWPRLLAVFVPVAVLWLPMIRFALRNNARIAWIDPITLDSTLAALVALGGGLVAAVVLGLLLVLGARRDVITLWLVVPIVGVIALSLLVQPTLQMHYLLGVVPAAAIIAARNRPALIAGLLAVCLVGVWNWYDRGAKDDWRGLAGWVAVRAEPSDGVVFSPDYMRFPFGYYAQVGVPLWPPFSWSGSYLRDVPADPGRFEGIDRIWLIEDNVPGLPEEIRTAMTGFSPTESRTFSGGQGIRATLLVRDAARGGTTSAATLRDR